jgi:DNA-binding HxlR family transcriptional regulator
MIGNCDLTATFKVYHALVDGGLPFAELAERTNLNRVTLSDRLHRMRVRGDLIHNPDKKRGEYELTQSGYITIGAYDDAEAWVRDNPFWK